MESWGDSIVAAHGETALLAGLVCVLILILILTPARDVHTNYQ
jgi:hypothetical protein